MSFGEAYQGMSDREILIEVAMDVRHQSERTAAQGIHLEKLEQKVDAIQCPSPRCQEHDRRLNTLETTERNRSDSGAALIAWGAVVVAIVAVVVSIFDMLGG